MSVKMDLKKAKIEVVEQIDTLTVNSIAKNISKRIMDTFPDFYLDKNQLFAKLSKLNMYKAKMPEGLAEACYFHKNCSIYFNEHIDTSDLEEFAIHECLHYLQEVKDKNNKLIRMGLCNYGIKTHGLGLNEAAVQYMASKIIGIQPDIEKYYGITIHTPSPSYYPIECTLLKEISYFVNEDIIFRSTFFSNDRFKKCFSIYTSKSTYEQIENSFDLILNLEEKLVHLNNKIALLTDGDVKITKLQKQIEKYKEEIAYSFFQSQNIIIQNFFNYEFDEIISIEQLEIFRKKLYKFSDIIGGMKDYKFFDNYYIEMMNKIDHKYNIIENGGTETALNIKTKNSFLALIEKVKKLFTKTTSKNKEF